LGHAFRLAASRSWAFVCLWQQCLRFELSDVQHSSTFYSGTLIGVELSLCLPHCCSGSSCTVQCPLPELGCNHTGNVFVSGVNRMIEQGVCTGGLHGCLEWCKSIGCKAGGALHASLGCLSVCLSISMSVCSVRM
jgi:hypothetical protein